LRELTVLGVNECNRDLSTTLECASVTELQERIRDIFCLAWCICGCTVGACKNKGEFMTRILLLGLDPETVDFSDPALPPGMTAEKVHAGIAVATKGFVERGWEFDVCFIRPDETAGPTVERQLLSTNYDCVVIGGGVRLPPRNLALFEVLINAIRKAAPQAAIAFNTRPDDSADAAARWVSAR
jgi:hypothetical protein